MPNRSRYCAVPEEFVQAIPTEILLESKMRVMNVDLDNGICIWGGTENRSVDRHEFLVGQKKVWDDGIRVWRDFFGRLGK
jgi:hypothetical protein